MLLVSIVKESVLLLDVVSGEVPFVTLFFHHCEDCGRYTQAPDDQRGYGDVVSYHLVLLVFIASYLIVCDESVHAVVVSAVEHVHHALSQSWVHQKEDKDKCSDEFFLEFVHCVIDSADYPPDNVCK